VLNTAEPSTEITEVIIAASRATATPPRTAARTPSVKGTLPVRTAALASCDRRLGPTRSVMFADPNAATATTARSTRTDTPTAGRTTDPGRDREGSGSTARALATGPTPEASHATKTAPATPATEHPASGMAIAAARCPLVAPSCHQTRACAPAGSASLITARTASPRLGGGRL
jgi:hypothetical protein